MTRKPYAACEISRSSLGAPDRRVDRKEGVIHHVKITGLQSENTGRVIGVPESEYGELVDKPYRYSLKALESAKHLYEGASVYYDHPEFVIRDGHRLPSAKERSVDDLCGTLKNVVVESDGLYGDLHILTRDRRAEKVFEAAERMPNKYALSHNALVNVAREGDHLVVNEISRVRSVDLVGDRPGTTAGLFESAAQTQGRPMKKTIKQILALPDKDKSKNISILEGMMKACEDDSGMGDASAMEVDAGSDDGDEMDTDEQVREGIKTILNAIVDDDSLTADQKIAKLKAYLKAHEAGEEKPNTSDEEDDDEDGSEASETASALVNIVGDMRIPDNEKLTKLTELAKKHATTPKPKKVDEAAIVMESAAMLSEAEIPTSEVMLQAVCGLPTKEARRDFIAKCKAAMAPNLQARSAERHTAVETAAQSGKVKKNLTDIEDAEKLLRGVA